MLPKRSLGNDGKAPPSVRIGFSELLPWSSGERLSPLKFYTTAARKHEGGMVRIQVWRLFDGYLISRPEHVRHVLQTNQRGYEKGEDYEALKIVIGEGLLSSNGELWLRQRRHVQPAFRRDKVAALAPTMTAEAEAMLTNWEGVAERGAPVDVYREMARLALRIVAKSLFGADLDHAVADRIGEAFAYLNRYVDKRMGGLLNVPVSVPTPENLRYRRSLKIIDGVIHGFIEGRRSGGPRDDLLGQLMTPYDGRTGERMSDDQVRDEAMTLLLAGHETTASSLSWTWYLLGKHPEAEGRLHGELQEVLAGRPPTFGDLENLPYARMVLQESLRMYPPAWMVSRRPLEDDHVGGYLVPAGSPVLISPYVIHRDPELWDDPEAFRPERFENGSGVPGHDFSYIPFGAGPRRCIGERFAMMEMQLVLATVAQRYSLSLLPGHTVEPEPVVTLRPRRGVPMVIRER